MHSAIAAFTSKAAAIVRLRILNHIPAALSVRETLRLKNDAALVSLRRIMRRQLSDNENPPRRSAVATENVRAGAVAVTGTERYAPFAIMSS